MSRFVIVEGNNNDKDNVRAIMVKGEKGASSYDLYVEHGGTLTEEEWLDSYLNADNYYSKDETDNLLDNKANSSDVYTKSEIDTSLDNKASATDMNEAKEDIEDLKGYALFESENGESGNILLSDSAGNYSYIEIYYRHSDNVAYKNSVKIKNPNNSYANLLYCLTSGNGNSLYINNKNIYISGTSITIQDSSRYSLVTLESSGISYSNTNTLYITDVIGYK